MKWRTVPEFCSKANIKLEHVTKTYSSLLRMMHNFITKNDFEIGKQVSVNRNILKEAVVAFYNDMARMKSYHVIDEPSFEKDDAYKAYWIIRRKPLQVIEEFKDCEFLNEQFATLFLLSGMVKKKEINDEKKASNPTWKDFRFLLYRNMKYRIVSQQSLELMIEAFFCGCDF
jgi:benzoyl-CoA reductase/2-hydroxyglutaryl-CoA dehydratase subunit BcrC/BadD/HgdB